MFMSLKKQKAVTVILVGACQRSETDMHMGVRVCVFNLLYLSQFLIIWI